jgi:Uma2 family endonuclease
MLPGLRKLHPGYIRRDRMPKLPFFSVAPDWVCEVLSPATARLDRILRMVDRSGRQDPRSLLHEKHWQLDLALKESDEVRAPPFEAISFRLDTLWA